MGKCTYKLHGTVVEEEGLHAYAPVVAWLEGPVALAGLTEVADPRVHLLQEVEGLRTHQDVHTVDAVGPGGGSGWDGQLHD